MSRTIRELAVAAGLLAAVTVSGMPASAQELHVKAGFLTCHTSSGWGFVFGSSRLLACEYSSGAGAGEDYTGSITKFGVDIGYLKSAVGIWAVFAPTASLAPGSLAGNYAGVTASAAYGIGGGANVLVGGSGNHIMLQPVSIEGDSGLNVAAGIAAVEIKAGR